MSYYFSTFHRPATTFLLVVPTLLTYHNNKNNTITIVETKSITTSNKPNKKLIQAHVVFRHGARTPVFYADGIVSKEMAELFKGKCENVNGPPGIYPGDVLPKRNHGDQKEPRARALILKDLDGGKRPPSEVDRFQLTKVYGECRAGQLTDLGAEQSMKLGQTLYSQYKDLFHQVRSKDGGLFLRTSNVARCVATLAYVLGEFEIEDDAELQVLTAHNHVETLYPNSRCALTALLFDAAKLDWSKNPTEEAIVTARTLRDKLPTSVAEKLRTDGYNFIRIRDYLVAYETHGLPLPWIDNDPELVKRVERIGAMQIARYLYHDTHLSDASSKAGIGQLLLVLTDMMKSKDEKMSLISAHDTTLMPLLSACRVWDGISWPEFCSYITLEVWGNDKDDANLNQAEMLNQRTVRVIFDGKLLLETSLRDFLNRIQPVLPDPKSDPCSIHGTGVQLPILPDSYGKQSVEIKDHW
jgi:hypothetical protein